MSSVNDWNKAIIDEFRANAGKVGGTFAGKTLFSFILLGQRVDKNELTQSPMSQMVIVRVIIASKGGAPTNPDWYYNIRANPMVTVEVGTERLQAAAAIATEPERTRLYNQMVKEMPGFAEYQRKTKRVIPVIILTPVR